MYLGTFFGGKATKEKCEHLINFCKSKGIKSEPLPKEYESVFLVPLKNVPEVRKESLRYDKIHKI